jgi:hypothetical protein
VIQTVSDIHHPFADLTYSITGSGTLTVADIILFDDSGVRQVYANVALPATYHFSNYIYENPWVWAQNASANFSDPLTVTIYNDSKPPVSNSSSGLYCIVEASSIVDIF